MNTVSLDLHRTTSHFYTYYHIEHMTHQRMDFIDFVMEGEEIPCLSNGRSVAHASDTHAKYAGNIALGAVHVNIRLRIV